MAKFFDSLNPRLIEFINQQKIFFVATAMKDGRINLSPKGLDSLIVKNENRVLWLNLTGSGNETSIHVQQSERMTIMMCSFEKNPLILRLYGKAKVYTRGSDEFDDNKSFFENFPGARQIFDMDVDMVQTSCGYAVPFMEFKGHRDTLPLALEKKEDLGIENYWKEKNMKSIDDVPTTEFTFSHDK